MNTSGGNTKIRAFACHGKNQALAEWHYQPRPLGPKDVEIRISHCGICASDLHTLNSGWGPTRYPCVVGHEIVGEVIQCGPQCSELRPGQRVGVGAMVYSCMECVQCRQGRDQLCQHRIFTYNDKYADGSDTYGGYAERIRVHESFAFVIPDGLPSDVVAPLLCAGATVFSPLRRFEAGPGKNVGVVGIGGLGHLALQFANKLGCTVTAVSHSASKRQQCLEQLGAHRFVNILSAGEESTGDMQSLDILLVTSNHLGQPWHKYLALMRPRGVVVMLGLPEEPMIAVPPGMLILHEVSLCGSLIGSRPLIKDMLKFAAEHQVHPWIERMPLEQVNEAVEKVSSGNVRYRMVLEI